MRILFWLSIGFDRRGPSVHLLTDMIEALYEKGHTVHVLQKDTHGPEGELPPALKNLGVETTRITCNLPNKNNLARRFFADIRYVLNCCRWLRKQNRLDRIFIQSANVAGIQTRLLALIQRSVPVVFNVQDIFPENALYSGKMKAESMAYRCFAAMQRHAYRYATRIITISEDMKDQLIEIGVPADKIDVVYNWSYRDAMYAVDQVDYSCLDGIIDRSKFNVVYAGNIGLMQNVELVVRTAARMKMEEDIRFHIIGEGMCRKKLERLAEELHTDNVSFHDMMDPECAPAIYCAADVNVIPLARNIYRTALPSKTATCLACGKPIVLAIGRKSRFAMRMRRKTNCPVIDCDDAGELCNAIRSFRENGNSCRLKKEFIMHFSNTKNRALYASIIENAA